VDGSRSISLPPPSVYGESVRVNAQDPVDIQKFTSEFLMNDDFFPDYGEAVAPGFDKTETKFGRRRGRSQDRLRARASSRTGLGCRLCLVSRGSLRTVRCSGWVGSPQKTSKKETGVLREPPSLRSLPADSSIAL
jgi:hypothetical protein